ncbi:MAG TPA: sulfite exporter TauE/SafE family protein, partial [Bryobacteraceae bacterium]|nr:sulfite exporter TauE/SafE family protein [Bryobacteraceae bacterium]
MLAFDVGRAAAAFAAAFVAGAINSIAGGGTLVSFPTLIWLGLPPVVANATNTVAVWPGSLGSMWGYRRELADIESRMLLLAVPSIVGGVAGALLLRLTPAPLFSQLVPFLILFATVLFMLQEPVQRWLRKSGGAAHDSGKWLAG